MLDRLTMLDHSSATALVSDLDRHKDGMFCFRNDCGDTGGPWRLCHIRICGSPPAALITIVTLPKMRLAGQHGLRKQYGFDWCKPDGLGLHRGVADNRCPWTILLIDPVPSTDDAIQQADRRRNRGLADIFG